MEKGRCRIVLEFDAYNDLSLTTFFDDIRTRWNQHTAITSQDAWLLVAETNWRVSSLPGSSDAERYA
jgi:hypothetical protein